MPEPAHPADPDYAWTSIYVCAGPGVLGRHGDLETPFRRFLEVIVQSRRVTLPPLLWECVADHHYRRDSEGRTLCFGGPLREQVLDLVLEWLVKVRGQHGSSEPHQLSFLEEPTP